MGRPSILEIIDKGALQTAGLTKYATDAKDAPFNAEYIDASVKKLQQLKTQQETAKAEAERLTNEMHNHAEKFQDELSRNINHFVGRWGKQDKRLLELSGHPASTTHRHHQKTESDKETTSQS